MNKVFLRGRLGKDPELKYTQSGTAVANFSVATDSNYKDKSGDWQKKTEWHNITAWARTAEIAGEYLKKGSNVLIEGRLETQSWEDKTSGEKKYKTVVVVESLEMLDKKPASTEGAEESQERTTRKPPAKPASHEITDEDIPF